MSKKRNDHAARRKETCEAAKTRFSEAQERLRESAQRICAALTNGAGRNQPASEEATRTTG